MRCRKRAVKWLDPEFPRVLFETIRIHQRNCAESSHIGVMQSSTIIQLKPQSRIVELVAPKVSVVYQQRPCEARLYHEAIAGVEVDDYELCPPPAANDLGVTEARSQRAWSDFAQDVALSNGDFPDCPTANRAVQIARDRLCLR